MPQTVVIGFENKDESQPTADGIEIQLLKEKKILDISVSKFQTIFLSEDGSIFNCKNKSHEQLKLEQICNHTEELDFPEIISQAKCGKTLGVALTQEGQVLSWENPKLVSFQEKIRIVKIQCGFDNTIALTDDGRIYSWGSNSEGQLGLGWFGGDYREPQLIRSLTGLAVSHLSAGASHTFVLTSSGALFGFGNNRFGQLGVGNNESKCTPEHCYLKNIRVRYVCCGDNHTTFLTRAGDLYTFGDGRDGQLGYESICETKPRKVELYGDSEVSMIACGSNHTIIYNKSDESVYTFGHGNTIPIKVAMVQKSIVRSLHAGGSQTFIILSTDSKYQLDNRMITKHSQAESISSEFMESCHIITDDMKEKIKKAFSSLSCINGSFYKNSLDPYCDENDHGINITACLKAFKLISDYKCNHREDLLDGLINVDQTFPNKLLSMEGLRIFVMLPLMHIFCTPGKIIPLLKPILSMDHHQLNVLGNWWQETETSYAVNLIESLKDLLCEVLEEKEKDEKYQMHLEVCLKIMKKIYYMLHLDFVYWYMEDLQYYANRKDFFLWYLKKFNMPTIFDYPFLFDEKLKVIFCQIASGTEMAIALHPNLKNNLEELYQSLDESPESDECFHLEIRRESTFEDMIEGLKNREAEYKKPLQVQFHEEEGIDYGGPGREFFRLLMIELINHKVFKRYGYSFMEMFWFSNKADLGHCEMVGVAFGLALYNSYNISNIFPLPLYKMLLKRPPTCEDFKELMPQVVKAFNELMEMNDEEDFKEYCLTFEFKGVCLVPDGDAKIVNRENRSEYKEVLTDYIFNKSVKDQLKAFRTGFLKVCGERMLELLNPEELRSVLVGKEIDDWNEVVGTAIVDDGEAGHQTITMLHEVFNELTVELKKKFLGSDRIPLNGMEDNPIMIRMVNVSEDHLPTAQTCSQILNLPPYQSKDTLRQKLLLAIESPNEFGFV